MPTVLSLIGALGIFILILFLAFYATKWMGKRLGGSGFGGHHIEVLEKVLLGSDRSLVIIRVGERVFLLGVTAHHIEKIEELEDFPKSPELPSSQEGETAFSEILKSTLEKGWGFKLKNKKDKPDE